MIIADEMNELKLQNSSRLKEYKFCVFGQTEVAAITIQWNVAIER